MQPQGSCFLPNHRFEDAVQNGILFDMGYSKNKQKDVL